MGEVGELGEGQLQHGGSLSAGHITVKPLQNTQGSMAVTSQYTQHVQTATSVQRVRALLCLPGRLYLQEVNIHQWGSLLQSKSCSRQTRK